MLDQQLLQAEQSDLAAMVADLNSLLRLKTSVIGMKLFARVEDMEAVQFADRTPSTPPIK